MVPPDLHDHLFQDAGLLTFVSDFPLGRGTTRYLEKNIYIYSYISESLSCTPEINTL